MTIQTMDKVHAACTVVPRTDETPEKFLQSPAGCSFQRLFNDDEGPPTFPGTYLITLDYPLDPLSCAYTCEPYFDTELEPSFGNLLISSFLLHIDDTTKVLVTLAPGAEGFEPIDAPIHFACWNTQANRGSLFEMTVADPAILPGV